MCSSFFYLTGFNEPEAIAVFIKNKNNCEYILFNRASDIKYERWFGSVIGQGKAVSDYGADHSFPVAEINNKIPELIKGKFLG